MISYHIVGVIPKAGSYTDFTTHLGKILHLLVPLWLHRFYVGNSIYITLFWGLSEVMFVSSLALFLAPYTKYGIIVKSDSRADSLENTLIQGKIEGRRTRG